MLKKAVYIFGLKLATAILNLLVVVIISQTMGATGKGECSLILTSMTFIIIFCNFIGGATLVYLVPRYSIFQLLVISYVWTFFICFLSVVFLYHVDLVQQDFIIPIGILAMLSSFFSINLNILLGKEKSVSNTAISFLQSVFTLALLLFFVFYFSQPNPFAYINSLYLAFGICIIISFFMLLPHLEGFSFNKLSIIIKELSKTGVVNQLGHITQFISLRISYYLLTKNNGAADLGIYSNGVSLAESIWLISNSIAMVQYGRIANSTDDEYKKRITLNLARTSTIICMVAIIILISLPSSFFTLLFGKEFQGVSGVIFVLSPGILFYNLFLIFGHYFSGNGNYKTNLYANVMGLIVTLILTALLFQNYGIIYAGMVSSISYIVTSVVIIYFFLKETNSTFSQLIPSVGDMKGLLNGGRKFFIKN